jgi:hypothetical protein
MLLSNWQQDGNNLKGNLDANVAGTGAGFAYDYNQLDMMLFTLNGAMSYRLTDLATGASLSGTLSGVSIDHVQLFRQNLAGDPNTGGGGGNDYKYGNLEIVEAPKPSVIAPAGWECFLPSAVATL